ncbi:efflux RND transporter periplasmic adaptor subunit [Candidatus Thiodiazotropha endoloripes]|uniref:efflux RND transporter periplasmic adaptor subunit n=1 Tax=Candidatus Thiodiazotropha endoloripes TaxID=1818881 RepID=UPI0013902DBA|nr:efflux RND transporter periplasmic adaptor subunit [Candidatus Thiodiazotropha endoloripes]
MTITKRSHAHTCNNLAGRHINPLSALLVAALVVLLLAGCSAPTDPAATDKAADPERETVEPPPSNRTPLTPVVRRNLGITFAKATYRPVQSTIAIPGHFELLTSAQHHYPVPASGRVKVHVAALDQVTRGQMLLELDAPAWRELQRELAETQASREQARAKFSRASATRKIADNLAGTEKPKGGVFAADEKAAQAAVNAASERLNRLLAEAATLTGVAENRLRKVTDGQPYWSELNHIPIRAVEDGVVREVDAASGTWVVEGTEVVHVVYPTELRFRGKALQADLVDHLRDGQSAYIHPPEGRGTTRRSDPIPGRLRIGVTGDPDTRTVDVFIDLDEAPQQPWIRPQVGAMAEIVVAGDPDMEELAIPLRAVIRDGLETVFFRRAPDDPDTVIRTVADLGSDDGRWVTVYSGLGENDEVVVDGAYQLKLATTGQKVKTGHFHTDGTFHEGED